MKSLSQSHNVTSASLLEVIFGFSELSFDKPSKRDSFPQLIFACFLKKNAR